MDYHSTAFISQEFVFLGEWSMTWGSGRHIAKWDELLDDIRFNRIQRYSAQCIQITASVIAIITFVITSLKSKKPEFWYVIFLLVYLIFLTIVLFIQSYRHARKSRYAEASRFFHPLVHMFRDAMFNISCIEEPDFKHTIEKMLTAFSSGMEIITGTKVRACVKLLRVDGGTQALLEIQDQMRKNELIYADLYACDAHSSWPKKKDCQYPYDRDRLAWNSAFCSLLNGEGNYYIENNIPRAYKNHRYQSSSFETYGEGQPGRPKWILPYKSTILWPIRKLKMDQDCVPPSDNNLAEGHHVLGFLCIDSRSRNVWEPRYDSEIGAAVADLLYSFMNTWFNEKEEQDAPSPD